MKKLLALLLTLTMTFSLMACGGSGDDDAATGGDRQVQQGTQAETPDDKNEADEPVSISGYLGTKTGKFYSAFINGAIKMEYEMEVNGEIIRMVSATKGDKGYTENYVDGQLTACSVIDDKDMYIIDHSTKMIIKMALQEDLLTVANTVVTEEDIDMAQLEKGSREIDGKKYDTESWIMEGDKVTMCFDGNNLKYIITDPGTGETVIKILDYSTTVDDSLFTVPAGYTVLDMSGQ